MNEEQNVKHKSCSRRSKERMMKRNALIAVVVAVGAVVLGVRLLGAKANGSEPTVIIHAAPVYFPLATEGTLHSIHLSTTPVIDGQLSDWPVGESVALNRDTSYSFSGRIDDTADLSSLIRSGWDDQHVYFAIQVTDDVVMADSTDVWRDDGVEIGLDGLNDEYAWGWDDHQYTVVVDGRLGDRGAEATGVTAGISQHEGGYDIEVAIPMSKLLSGSPISGTVMGFTIGLHDDDDGDSWDAYLIWQGTNTSTSPEEYGDLLFTARAEDRLIALEARLVMLERKLQEVLIILQEFQGVAPPD
jgi:hypothetical protein